MFFCVVLITKCFNTFKKIAIIFFTSVLIIGGIGNEENGVINPYNIPLNTQMMYPGRINTPAVNYNQPNPYLNAYAIYPTQPAANNNQPQGDVRTTLCYFNDVHSSLKIGRVKTIADNFTKTYQADPHVDGFKISAGDIYMGKDKAKLALDTAVLNSIGLDVSAIGNHELDSGTAGFAEQIKSANFKYVATNLDIDDKSELSGAVKANKIVKSTIINRNGHNYGFIGAMPIDLMDRKSVEAINGLEIDDLKETIDEIQEEVKNLQKQGINKIILISHLGHKNEVEIAKNVTGLDVIIGGHSHDIIKGLTKDQNVITSPGGEPVVITQAGQDAEFSGLLDIVFDSNGVIKAASNKLNRTNDWQVASDFAAMKDRYLGKAEPIGYLTADCHPENSLAYYTSENPIASFILDSIRHKTGVQFAMVNSGAIRGQLDAGQITTRDIKELAPFSDKMYKVKLSEKDLIDTLNICAKSSKMDPPKPGLMQVSGLRYTVTPSGTVKDIEMQNPDGSYTKLNSNFPDSSKYFVVAYDEYLFKGAEFPLLHKKENILEEYSWRREDATMEYIRSLGNKPFEIKSDGRIKLEAAPKINPVIFPSNAVKQAAFKGKLDCFV